MDTAILISQKYYNTLAYDECVALNSKCALFIFKRPDLETGWKFLFDISLKEDKYSNIKNIYVLDDDKRIFMCPEELREVDAHYNFVIKALKDLI